MSGDVSLQKNKGKTDMQQAWMQFAHTHDGSIHPQAKNYWLAIKFTISNEKN